MPEKKLIKKQTQSKVDLKTNLRSSEIKLLEQITTIKESSQLKQLLSQQPTAVQKVPLKIESNCKDQESKMAQDCGSCVAKYILCLFNFIFFVSISTFSSSLLSSLSTNFYFFIFLDSWISRTCTWCMDVG